MIKKIYNKIVLRAIALILVLCATTRVSFGQVVGDYGFVQTTATSGQYLAATINNWVVCQSAGTWTGATTATLAVGGSVNAFIRTGTTCALSGSTSFKNLTIESTAAFIAAIGTTSGSPKGVRINGSTLFVDGTLGGTGNAGVDGYLSIEPQLINGTVKIKTTASGTVTISRARPSASATTGITLKLNIDITFITTGQVFSTNGASNTTIEIGAGKTITIPSGYVAISNNPTADLGTGANAFVVNIYGNLNL